MIMLFFFREADSVAILRDHAPCGDHKIIIHLLLMICDYAGQADFIAILRDHATGGCSRGHKLPFMIMFFFPVKSGEADSVAILSDHAPCGDHKIIIHPLLVICD